MLGEQIFTKYLKVGSTATHEQIGYQLTITRSTCLGAGKGITLLVYDFVHKPQTLISSILLFSLF